MTKAYFMKYNDFSNNTVEKRKAESESVEPRLFYTFDYLFHLLTTIYLLSNNDFFQSKPTTTILVIESFQLCSFNLEFSIQITHDAEQ